MLKFISESNTLHEAALWVSLYTIQVASYLMDILSSYFTAVLPPADKRVTEANSLPITDGDVTSSVITHASGKGSVHTY